MWLFCGVLVQKIFDSELDDGRDGEGVFLRVRSDSVVLLGRDFELDLLQLLFSGGFHCLLVSLFEVVFRVALLLYHKFATNARAKLKKVEKKWKKVCFEVKNDVYYIQKQFKSNSKRGKTP